MLGPGYLESVYERAVCAELQLRGVELERQVPISLRYKGTLVGEHRFDLLIRGYVECCSRHHASRPITQSKISDWRPGDLAIQKI